MEEHEVGSSQKKTAPAHRRKRSRLREMAAPITILLRSGMGIIFGATTAALLAWSVTARADSPTGGPSADPPVTNYVALGDSFSAGVGNLPTGYPATFDLNSVYCLRSNQAFPQLFANAHSLSGSTFSFPACELATTDSVINSQLSAITSTTDLITVSAGGNDVGFAKLIVDCTATTSCVSSIDAAITQAQTVLPDRLTNLYNSINSKKSSSATVIVIGYPVLFANVENCVVANPFTQQPFNMTRENRTAANNLATQLNTVTRARALAAGYAFLDPSPWFANNLICGSNTPWINALHLPVNLTITPDALS
ncbi:SGNH/GDSL hydrolase family protein [Planosporangium sp. 12N6]|uniref:SGNH/GDSL hydrolase family protein n=1 Tax=Planosporangium spinosum TaxID=3402278 RepID=UPI003CF0F132